jgi:hypothetical protein
VADRLTNRLSEIETALREGRRLLGGRVARVDSTRVAGALDYLLVEFAVEARAVRWAEQRRGTDGDPPLGPLPEPDDVLKAAQALQRFVSKRRSDVASLGHGTWMWAPRLELLLGRLLELATPWARQFRDYASFFPHELDEAELFRGIPATDEQR